MLLPLLVACFLAHAFTVLTLKRSILTEKISRRGYHLTREYATDPLEIIFVREVMQAKTEQGPSQIAESAVVAYTDEPLRAVVYRMAETGLTRLPVVNPNDRQRVVGVVSLEDLLRARSRDLQEERFRERVLRVRRPRARRRVKV